MRKEAEEHFSLKSVDKIEYNRLSKGHRAIVSYLRYSLLIEQAYLGVEQTNADARRLVLYKAGVAYDEVVRSGLKSDPRPELQRIDYIRENADTIVDQVIAPTARRLHGFERNQGGTRDGTPGSLPCRRRCRGRMRGPGEA